ncbi:conserved hypothethical protein [Ralstonia solanacearum PSI07]|nr:conserved hypothethical protein [Ralstonia solanacearum PSI07]
MVSSAAHARNDASPGSQVAVPSCGASWSRCQPGLDVRFPSTYCQFVPQIPQRNVLTVTMPSFGSFRRCVLVICMAACGEGLPSRAVVAKQLGQGGM